MSKQLIDPMSDEQFAALVETLGLVGTIPVGIGDVVRHLIDPGLGLFKVVDTPFINDEFTGVLLDVEHLETGRREVWNCDDAALVSPLSALGDQAT